MYRLFCSLEINFRFRENWVRVKITFLLKLAFSMLIMAYLFTRLSLHQVYDFWQTLSLSTILVLFFLFLVNLMVQLWRWRTLVISHLPKTSFDQIIKSFFAGFTLRLSVPGGYAEVGKIFLVSGGRKETLFAFGMEKYIIASTQFLLVGFAGMYILPEFYAGSFTMVVLAVTLFTVYPYFKKFPFLKRHLDPDFPYSSSMIIVAVLTVMVYALVTTQYYFMLLPEKVLTWLEMASVVIILIGSAMIPISYSGLGVREGVGIFLFQRFDVGQEIVVGMTLLIFLLNIVLPAIVGMVVIFKFRK